MSFLSCTPAVFVIGDEYEILVNFAEKGICSVEIEDAVYYEENSGALSSEKTYAKIRVPQSALNVSKTYTVAYRRAVDRKAYFSELGELEREKFSFKPLEKTEGINLYLISDVHYRFDIARQTAGFFGDDVDLFVVNGDIGEVETEDNYFEVCRFVGDISGGMVPVIFARGNHDTRGRLAERFTDFFPSDGKKTYFTFEVGSLCGVVLDCGEDKRDFHKEYGGVNDFEGFRRRETEFLKKVAPRKDKLTFAVSHICPAQTDSRAGCIFDIERELYARWNEELSRIGIRFMLCGHTHKAYILEKNDERSLLPHDYPVVVGVECVGKEDIWGSAITLGAESMTVRFTNKNKETVETHIINY